MSQYWKNLSLLLFQIWLPTPNMLWMQVCTLNKMVTKNIISYLNALIYTNKITFYGLNQVKNNKPLLYQSHSMVEFCTSKFTV